VNWFPVLLVLHIALAISLLAPSLLLPFLLRRADAAGGATPGTVTGLLLKLQGTGTLIIGAGLALTGAGLLVVLGAQLLTQFWLLAGLVLYAANLLVAAFVSRPNLRRMVRLEGGNDEIWRRRARQQRYVAYGMAAMVGVIGLLMSTKPDLW
jgi:hypothetical protein